MIKLGIYCPGVGTGGPWRCVHSILDGIDPAEFDVSVFCDIPGVYEPRPWVKIIRLREPQSASAQPVAASSAPPIQRQRKPDTLWLWAGFAKEARRLARIFRQHPCDILHTQNTGCEESPVAAKLAGIPNVLGTFHVDSTYDLQRERSGPRHRLLEMVSNRCLDTAIAVSHTTKRDWLKRTHISADRIATIHNGIDAEKFRRRRSRRDAREQLGLPPDAVIIGGLGRLDEAKGFEYLLEAVALLRGEFPNLCVAIAGEGPLRQPLEERVRQLGLAGQVRFLGFLSDVQSVLDALDVFALSSLCEALPFALLEAMATELPALGTTVGGVPEVIVEGETGFLVPPRNPLRLAAALRILLQDADLRMRMGIAGRQRVVTHFREDDMVRKTIAIYRSSRRHP